MILGIGGGGVRIGEGIKSFQMTIGSMNLFENYVAMWYGIFYLFLNWTSKHFDKSREGTKLLNSSNF